MIILQFLTCKLWEDFHLAKPNWQERMPTPFKTSIIKYLIILLKRRLKNTFNFDKEVNFV